MILVAPTIPVGIGSILGIPTVARIVTGPSGRAIHFDPDIAATVIALQRPAASGFQPLAVQHITQDQRKQNCAEQGVPPPTGQIISKQKDLICARAPNV